MTAAQDNLRKALDHIHEARRIAAKLVPEAFPVGSTASYRHGDLRRFVTVLEHHDTYPHVRVKGVGSDYWVDAWKLLEL